MKQSWLLFERCLFNFGRKKEAGWPKFPKKSPRITKNINGYTKRTSLQKENKTKKKKKNRQAKHQDWKEFTKKLLYQNSLQKRRRESGCKKTGGLVGNHGFPDSSFIFCLKSLVFRVYFTESKFFLSAV